MGIKRGQKQARDILRDYSPTSFIQRVREEGFVTESEKPKGVIIPNATQIPNEVLDQYLPDLSGAELKVLLYIIRKTFGYNKREGDRISLSQIINGVKTKEGKVIDKGTGLSKRTAIRAVQFLEKAGLLKVERFKNKNSNNEINFYRLITREEYR
ncbi:replication protein [Candidatus Dojkabacteria bacterium]|nr:replication protein [Candidatus Dojkabacteria bacterium]